MRFIILRNKPSIYCTAIRIAGSSANSDYDNEVYNYLVELNRSNIKEFEKKWVKIKFIDGDAVGNIWDILFDFCYYCHNEKNYRLKDTRDSIEKMVDRYDYGVSSIPMGKLFYLSILSKSTKRVYKIFSRSITTESLVLINTQNVYKIEGILDNFMIHSSDFIMYCHHEIGINLYPPNIDTALLSKLMLNRRVIS